MTKQEKIILRSAIDSNEGLLSPAILINSIAGRDRQSVENLVVQGYLEEVPRELSDNHHGYYTENFYRVTAKGLTLFAPGYTKLWLWIQHDIRTIVITVITATITTVITLSVQKLFE